MTERRQSQTRRVSFALEPEVKYISSNRYGNTKSSSYGSDAPMDLTTEVPEFKNLFLFQGSMSRLPDEDIFDTEGGGVFEGCDDSMEASEYVRKLSISAKKNSLDALKENQDTKEESNVKTSEYSDIINSSCMIEELISTVDLKAMIPQPKKERQDLNEFLASVGIRFLDETIIDSLKRDTLSKSRNVVEPSLISYYKYSMKERIDYLQSFSGYLAEKMQDLQTSLIEVQSAVDVETLNKEKLKKIRNESRNRARVDWYTLRKINELQFNKKIQQNKLELEERYEKYKKDINTAEQQIKERKESIQKIEDKIKEIKKRLSERKESHKVERLQEMINERRSLLASLKDEHSIMLEETQNTMTAISRIDTQIESLKVEISSMRKNFHTRSISESVLEDIKRRAERYVLFFDFRVLKITSNCISFQTNGINFDVTYNKSMLVTACEVKCSLQNTFCPFSKNIIGLSLREAIRMILQNMKALKMLYKALDGLRSKHKVDSFYVENKLHIHVSSSDPIVFYIDDSLNVIYRESPVVNLSKHPQEFSNFLQSLVVQ